MKRQQQKTPYGPESGISMVLVVVMLMVFMILGAAVLGAASATTAAATRNGADRQAYYYARSAVDVLDASLKQEDGLGPMVLRAAADAENGALADFAPTVTLPADAGLTGLAVRVAFTGNCTLTDVGDNVHVECPAMEMKVTSAYQEQTYVVYVTYRCSGTVAAEGGAVSDMLWTPLRVK